MVFGTFFAIGELFVLRSPASPPDIQLEPVF